MHTNECECCAAFDSLAPASSPFGLPVYVARVPAAPFCETPILNSAANPTTNPAPAGRMNTNVVGRAVSDAIDLTTEIAEVTEFRQNERNSQNRGNGISEMEGKAARVAARKAGADRVSSHRPH